MKKNGKNGHHAKNAIPRRILAVDVGGNNVKLLATGETEARKVPSGPELTPDRMVEAVREATDDWRYDAVSIGLPARVGPEGLLSEPGNLGHGWVGFDFATAFECPVRMANDAAMQALGAYDGGRMLFLGLGTGLGSALILEHVVVPLELGDLPSGHHKTFSDRLGRKGLKKKGEERWQESVLRTIPALQKAFLADYVVIGGGNAKRLPKVLPPGVRLSNNRMAFRGGFRLWGIDEVQTLHEEGRQPVLKVVPRQASGEWRIL